MDTTTIAWPTTTAADAAVLLTCSAVVDADDELRPSTRWARGLPDSTVERVSRYMAAHLGESISLETLARIACMSRFHFARRFRQSTGRSPMAYLLAMRIARAQHLLAAGDCKIADIAAELGFFDQSHFARTFRRNTGMSPRAYAVTREALNRAG